MLLLHKLKDQTDVKWRGPQQYHSQSLQATFNLLHLSHFFLGYCHDVHGVCPKLCWTSCHPPITGAFWVRLSVLLLILELVLNVQWGRIPSRSCLDHLQMVPTQRDSDPYCHLIYIGSIWRSLFRSSGLWHYQNGRRCWDRRMEMGLCVFATMFFV